MLNKISGLARTLYILLAVVAGFVAIGMMNVPLALVVLGLIAGISMPKERLILAMVAVVALPLIGTALTQIPAIGAQLNAVMLNLQMGAAGAAATGTILYLFDLATDGVKGFTGGTATGTAATA